MAKIKIGQKVEHNLGQVVGIQTKTIHGNVYGGDIYEVQVYALTAKGRKEVWDRFVEEGTLPYRYLSPYRVQDRAIFMARKSEISDLLQLIGQHQLVILYGQPGVGKTSLIAAGVIPDLLENGAMVLHLYDCLNPVKSIHAAVAASAEKLPPLSSGAQTLPEIVKEIVDALKGSLVLVFDQFERLFDSTVDLETRNGIVQSLSQSLGIVSHENYRVVIVIRESALGQLIAMKEILPELGSSCYNLQAIKPQPAQEAIEGPLVVLKYPVSYVGDFVKKNLIPDLDDLSETQGIHPPHLQIVCYWLYMAARNLQPPHIDEQIYFSAKGADGIIARHFDDILRTQFGDERSLAEQILLFVTSREIEHWTPEKLFPGNGASQKKMDDVLNKLVNAELLVRRSSNGSNEYALTSSIISTVIPTVTGSQPENKLRAEQELERAWTAWLARGVPATKGQLLFLEQICDHLQIDAMHSLLLLYSAVVRELPIRHWLNRFKTDEGRVLLRQLDGLPINKEECVSSHSIRKKAELLLDLLYQNEIMENSPDRNDLFGRVSMTAVKNNDSIHRQTAALALTAIGGQLAISRLDMALKDGLHGRQRRSRAAELRGVLSDADPELEALFSELPFTERLGIWWWRTKRRIYQDRNRIFWLTLGGALGAGICLGFLRAIIAVPAERTLIGAQFANYAFSGGILGAAITFGMVMAKSLLFSSQNSKAEKSILWKIPTNQDNITAFASILAGTIFFWLGHIIVLAFSSLSPLDNITDLLRTGTVILAGLGLSVALFDQPLKAIATGYKRWLRRPVTYLRMGFASLFVLTGEVVFYFTRNRANSLAIAWGSDFYKSSFFNLANNSFPEISQAIPNWPAILAFIDAVLIGIVMTIGITGGLYLAQVWLTRWRELSDRVVD